MAESTIPKQRVLIVDDSRIVRTTISRLIRSSFDVREEMNGETGWQAIVSDPTIAVVFSDIQMPELDGFGLLERIRGADDARVCSLPVIMISGDEEETTKKRAREAGANDFITKTTDGTEILSRIDNLLRLVEAKQQLEVNQKAVEQTATHDTLTGTFTPHYLLTEGRKHFSHARRHGNLLAVLAFRVETYTEISQKVGKTVADQLLARIAKQVLGTLRKEDSMGRTGESTFAIISASSSSQQALSFARRLYEQLDKAQIRYAEHVLRIHPVVGLAGIDVDAAETIEELIKLALQRLQQAAGKRGERVVGGIEVPAVAAPAVAPEAAPVALPGDIELALRVIEKADLTQLGDWGAEVLLRLLPFVQAVCKRAGINLPVDKIAQALKARPK